MSTFVKGNAVLASGRRVTVVAADGDTAWVRNSAGENIFALVSNLVPEKQRGDDPGGAAGPIPQETVDRVKEGGPL